MTKFHQLIIEMVELLKQDKRILVHCNGGKGRTATVVVSCLIFLGLSVQEVNHL